MRTIQKWLACICAFTALFSTAACALPMPSSTASNGTTESSLQSESSVLEGSSEGVSGGGESTEESASNTSSETKVPETSPLIVSESTAAL